MKLGTEASEWLFEGVVDVVAYDYKLAMTNQLTSKTSQQQRQQSKVYNYNPSDVGHA